MEDSYFQIMDQNGNLRDLMALSFISDPDEEQNYIIYTDNATDENNKLNIYVSTVVREDDEFSLQEVQDYQRLDFITKEIDRILKEGY